MTSATPRSGTIGGSAVVAAITVDWARASTERSRSASATPTCSQRSTVSRIDAGDTGDGVLSTMLW